MGRREVDACLVREKLRLREKVLRFGLDESMAEGARWLA